MKKIIASFVFLFLLAFPLSLSAAPAFVELNVNPSSVSAGEVVTFTVTVTPQTNFVFATMGGVRTQGMRMAGNNWSVSVSPTQSTTVSIFASATNNETGAAVLNVPVVVGGATPAARVPAHTVAIPPAPANLGPIAIASVTETPAISAGSVQLTVVTGNQASDVWVNFDRENNVRGTGRFALGTMVSQDANSRTWVINFTPGVWQAQSVEVGSNRAYRWQGAEIEAFSVTLSQPFVQVVEPRINNATVSPRTVNRGSATNVTITTNLDAEYVWIRDADGREFNATRGTTTATNRNWTLRFSPQRTGAITIFANDTRTETGAATRTENITIGARGGDGNARFVGTPTATWVDRDTTRINVTTNAYAETVWVELPGRTSRLQLTRSNAGAGNRTWTVDAWDSEASGDIVIRVSSNTGTLSALSYDESRTVRRTDTSDGQISNATLWFGSGGREVRRHDWAEFRVFTSLEVDDLQIAGTHGRLAATNRGGIVDGEREWYVAVEIVSVPSGSGNVNFTLHAYIGNTRVDTRTLPAVTILP